MTAEHLIALEEATSTKRACELLGVSRATVLRRRRPPLHGPAVPRPAPPNKLTDPERQHVLSVLRSPEYCDLALAQVWARLLDDGIYLCSIRTMYRLLAIAGESRERRRQRTHPARKKPELIARAPDQVWSWDLQCRRRLLMSYAVRAVHVRLDIPQRGGSSSLDGRTSSLR